MLEVKKIGKSKYGVWILGILRYSDFEIKDIFNTNLSDIPSDSSLEI